MFVLDLFNKHLGLLRFYENFTSSHKHHANNVHIQ